MTLIACASEAPTATRQCTRDQLLGKSPPPPSSSAPICTHSPTWLSRHSVTWLSPPATARMPPVTLQLTDHTALRREKQTQSVTFVVESGGRMEVGTHTYTRVQASVRAPVRAPCCAPRHLDRLGDPLARTTGRPDDHLLVLRARGNHLRGAVHSRRPRHVAHPIGVPLICTAERGLLGPGVAAFVAVPDLDEIVAAGGDEPHAAARGRPRDRVHANLVRFDHRRGPLPGVHNVRSDEAGGASEPREDVDGRGDRVKLMCACGEGKAE